MIITAEVARANTQEAEREALKKYKKIWEKKDEEYVNRRIYEAIANRQYNCKCSWCGTLNDEYFEYIRHILEESKYEVDLVYERDNVINMYIHW